jgi:hypothetical protein
MDFIVLSTLMDNPKPVSLTLSYDIACQWSRNMKKRVTQFPEKMQLPLSVLHTIKYVIPKFHIYGHGRSCQTRFSLNFLPHSARTNGEEPERWWAHINPISMSTREMTAGARHDTIDDHAGSWNWRKITNLGMVVPLLIRHHLIKQVGKTLAAQLCQAHKMKVRHEELLEDFSAEFPPEVIQRWTKDIEAWNADPSKPNPYEDVEMGMWARLLSSHPEHNLLSVHDGPGSA